MYEKIKIKQAYDMIRIPEGRGVPIEYFGREESVRQNSITSSKPVKVRRGGRVLAAALAVTLLAGGVLAAVKLSKKGVPIDIAAPGLTPTVVADNGDIRLTVSDIRCDGHILLVHYDYEKLYSDRTDLGLEFSINNRLHSIFMLNSKEKGWAGWDEIMIERNNEGSNGDEVKDGDRVGILNDYTESAEAEVSIYVNEDGTDTDRLNKVLDMTENLKHRIRIEKTCEAISFKSETGGLVTVSELGIYGDLEPFELMHPEDPREDLEEYKKVILTDKQGREYDITEKLLHHQFYFGADETDYRFACPISVPIGINSIEQVRICDKVYTRTANAK